MNPRLGLILLFEGDYRKVNVPVKNVTTFSAVSAVLKQGDTDVTSTYINSTITSVGNVIMTDTIGEKASMPQGYYRYFITGTYGNKESTWYLDVWVLPKNASILDEIPNEDYTPLIEEVTMYEGDVLMKSLVVAGITPSTASGIFTDAADDKTSTYCGGAVAVSGDTTSTHLIGGSADVPAGEYAYFLTLTYNNSQAKTTFYYRINVLAKQGII
jgi:hypothetical protein